MNMMLLLSVNHEHDASDAGPGAAERPSVEGDPTHLAAGERATRH